MAQASELGTERLLVVGGGRMGEALVAGLLAAGLYMPQAITIVERLESRRQELTDNGGLADRYPGLTVTESLQQGSALDLAAEQVFVDAVLAVKPSDAETACGSLAAAGARRVLSIMAGITLGQLDGWLAPPRSPSSGPAVIRAMPNTPALIGAGAAAIAAGRAAGPADIDWAQRVLEAVGTVVVVPEKLLDAVTGLSGSGPAYVFLFAEALIDAGVLVGLPRQVARDLAVQTLLGSARLLSESGDTPEFLRAAVTSPGGTTAAGLRALEAAAVRSAILDAVTAATERSRQLGL